MGNIPKFNQAIAPTIDDIKSMLSATPIFGAEGEPAAPPKVEAPPVVDPAAPPAVDPLAEKVKTLEQANADAAAELKKYKDAEEAAQRKNNTDAENAKKDLEAVTGKWTAEETRANTLASKLENEILINKVLATGKFKSEAIEFVIQKLDRQKVVVNTDTRDVSNLDKALEEVAKNYALFVADGNSNNGVTPGRGGNGNNGDNQNGNPWSRAGAPPAPPASRDQEAAKRDSMQHRYSALRSGR